MTPDDLLSLFGPAFDGDVGALCALLDVLPSLGPLEREWVHQITHLHADLEGIELECDHGDR